MTMVTFVSVRTQTIQASEFKARCLALMDETAATGQVLVITKNGRPIAELHPVRGNRLPTPFALHPQTQIKGDIVAPVASDDWQALA